MNVTCSRCQTPLAPADVLYDEIGSQVCQACVTKLEIVREQASSVGKLKGVAFGAPAVGLGSFVVNPFCFFSIALIANGIYVLKSVRHPDTAKHLEGSVEKVKVAAIAGMVLGGASGLLRLLMMGATLVGLAS